MPALQLPGAAAPEALRIVATAGPQGLVQLLTPEGDRVDHPDYRLDDRDPDDPPDDGGPDGDDLGMVAARLRSLYRDMALVRRVDEEGTALQRQGQLGLWASLRGQEAAQVGSARALAAADMAFPTYREHGVALCRGVDAVQLLAVFRGLTHGGWDPHKVGLAPYSIVVGSQALHAVGYALGIQRDAARCGARSGTDAGAGGAEDAGRAGAADPARFQSGPAGGPVAVAYFGDGASSQGDVNEAFVWAGVYNAPVVFFCQNNQWAISQPTERQTRLPLFRRADGFGFPGVRVDGNDVLAVLAVTRAALRRARAGGGPTLIEAYTYRIGSHTTADDATRYRRLAEVEMWKLKDPLERVKAFLQRRQLADATFFEQVGTEADELAARLRRECLAIPDAPPTAMFDNVYAGDHPLLRRQRRYLLDYLESSPGPDRVPQ